MTVASGGPPLDRLCALVKRESLGGAYALLTFEHEEVSRALAGQFAMIQPEISGDLLLRRPFSIMDVDSATGRFTIFLKAVGAGSKAVFDLRAGERARVLGPLGHGFSLPAASERVVMVGGGYGVAPFALFSRVLKPSPPFHLFYGGRSAAELPLVRELERRGIPLTLSTDDGTRGEKGRVTGPLVPALSVGEGTVRLYACGPEAMMHAVAGIAAEREIPCEVSLDPWMGCGIGTCLGCVVKIQEPGEGRPRNRPACTEGPVFDSRRVIWPQGGPA
ncbi:MAG: dihydroorotate dehydrogenase electron transfer subunit [Vicinamibacteria bacterium]|nr:dihydroorotate dehydrogenase electron transfer subunit [Vicinamibacteria bacterium]